MNKIEDPTPNAKTEKPNKIEYLATDAETGGTDPKVNPILTAYFAALDENFNLVNELSLFISPFEGSVVEEEALAANGIRLEEHLARPDILTPAQAAEALLKFLNDIQAINGKRKGSSPMPLGHNVTFDLNMYTEQLIPVKTWDSLVSYKTVDTFVYTNLLKKVEMLPKDLGSLGSLIKFYDIDDLGAHNAKADVHMTISVYRKMTESLLNLKNNVSAQPKIDVLKEIE